VRVERPSLHLYILTNRKLGMYMGIYTSEIFALESKAELEGSMPGLGWNLEEVYHHEIRRAYPPKGDAVIRRLISLNSVRNETPKRLMPYQYQNPAPEKHVPIFGMPRSLSDLAIKSKN